MPVDIDYEQLYRDVLPSVVSIYRDPTDPGGRGAGSGFVYSVLDDGSPTGVVVTNEHVIRGGTDVDVRTARGDWCAGTVVGTDVYTDLAVVRVADLPAYAAPLSVATENPAPGRPVAALGNPLGLDGSITAGIVSGANRSMPTGSGFAIPDVVQTDAAINPGNSGGPLVAERSGPPDDGSTGPAGYEVVGVNRAKSGDNIGFAISPAIATRVVPSLIDEGRYPHSYLRVRTLDVTPAVAEANRLPEARGVLIVDAHPSVRGTLRPCRGARRIDGREIPVGGDVIVGIGGEELRSHEELMRYLITETRPGEAVDVDLVREGRRTAVRITLAARPAPDADGGTPIAID